MTQAVQTTARPRQPARRQANQTPTATPPPVCTTPNIQRPQINNWEKTCQLLRDKTPQIAKVIPVGTPLTAESIVQNAMQQVATSRDSARLKLCTGASMLYAITACATIGLDFASDLAYLVSFERTEQDVSGARLHHSWEAKLLIGYRGYLSVAARHGYIIQAQVVHQGEDCEILLGTSNSIRHVANFNAINCPVIGAYSVLRNAETDFVVGIDRMSRGDIDAIAAGSNSPAWKNAFSFPEMARKTIVRRAFKWLPKDASDLRTLSDVERSIETGEPLKDVAVGLIEGKSTPAAQQ